MIYIVTGATGEYSDRSEWLIRAYTNEAQAREHVMNAENWYRQNVLNGKKKLSWDDYLKRSGEWGINPYDPKMEVDYTGTYYFLQEVEMSQ